jgi:hypothetical protein
MTLAKACQGSRGLAKAYLNGESPYRLTWQGPWSLGKPWQVLSAHPSSSRPPSVFFSVDIHNIFRQSGDHGWHRRFLKT